MTFAALRDALWTYDLGRDPDGKALAEAVRRALGDDVGRASGREQPTNATTTPTVTAARDRRGGGL